MGSRIMTRASWYSSILVCSLFMNGWVLNAWAADPIAWSDLGSNEQKVLAPFKDKWEGFSAERQQRLQQGAQRWQTMTPDQKTRARRINFNMVLEEK